MRGLGTGKSSLSANKHVFLRDRSFTRRHAWQRASRRCRWSGLTYLQQGLWKSQAQNQSWQGMKTAKGTRPEGPPEDTEVEKNW